LCEGGSSLLYVPANTQGDGEGEYVCLCVRAYVRCTCVGVGVGVCVCVCTYAHFTQDIDGEDIKQFSVREAENGLTMGPRPGSLLALIRSKLPAHLHVALDDMMIVLARERIANPGLADALSAALIEEQNARLDRARPLLHQHGDPAQGLRADGWPYLELGTWTRGESADRGDQLRNEAGELSHTGKTRVYRVAHHWPIGHPPTLCGAQGWCSCAYSSRRSAETSGVVCWRWTVLSRRRCMTGRPHTIESSRPTACAASTWLGSVRCRRCLVVG
jgi:hypothetical protein